MGYFGLYIVSLFGGNKRIMAEGIMVAQVAYVGLAEVSVISPLHYAITGLTSANNPYNIYYS